MAKRAVVKKKAATKKVMLTEKWINERVRRYEDLEFGVDQYLDTKIPGHSRSQANMVGHTSSFITGDPDYEGWIPDDAEFWSVVIKLPPQRVGALHDHKTTEMFMPLDGKLVLMLGDKGEHEVELGVHDVASFPPGVMRGFRNPSRTKEVNFMVCVGGEDPGRILWPNDVVEEAGKLGWAEDTRGKVVRRAAKLAAE